MSYTQVSEALDRGVEPEMICSTCPWDRLCIKPPAMTRGEVAEKTKAPDDPDDVDVNKVLINLLVFSGKDKSAEICPVLAVRLRSSAGKRVADEVRRMMTDADLMTDANT